MGLTRVATYEREIAASLTRIWENLFDWEHLPWLHASSFAAIELIEERPDGWHARVKTHPADSGPWLEIEVVAWRDENRYVTRTVAGPGTGTEIWTTLTPVGGAATSISVEFRVPDVAPEKAEGLGAAYTRLYTRLWDEDESMMVERQHRLDTRVARRSEPSGRVALGGVDGLRARLPLTVEAHGRPWRVRELDGALVAHSAICPHLLGPLDCGEVEAGVVRCPWHGYRFELSSGASADGRGYRLDPAPDVVVDPKTREAWLQWSRP